MACLMNSFKVPVQTLVKILNLGTLSLGKCRMDLGESAGFTRMFTLKKNGMDFVGQVRVGPGDPSIRICCAGQIGPESTRAGVKG